MQKPHYERKMHVGYEAFTKKVSVYFRGERKVLPALYNSLDEGIKAGEAYCLDKGWQPEAYSPTTLRVSD